MEEENSDFTGYDKLDNAVGGSKDDNGRGAVKLDLPIAVSTVSALSTEGVKRKESSKGRKDKKDKQKGYVPFEGASSEEELWIDPSRLMSVKCKKLKSGIFRTRSKLGRKDKDKEKEKSKSKERDKSRKKSSNDASVSEDSRVYGVPLSVATERSRLPDGVELPCVFRYCIDCIEAKGLTTEGIYRVSGSKSRVEALRSQFDQGEAPDLFSEESSVIASLLKLYLRELPEHVFTEQLQKAFEDASAVTTDQGKIDTLNLLLNELPECNKLLVSWLIVHMHHVIQNESENKMNIPNICIILSPTLNMSHRLLNTFFTLVDSMLPNVHLRPCSQQVRRGGTRSLQQSMPSVLRAELHTQEEILANLHTHINNGQGNAEMEEQLWEVQRIVTQLNRKLRTVERESEKTAGSSPNLPQPEDIPSHSPLHTIQTAEIESVRDTPPPIPRHSADDDCVNSDKQLLQQPTVVVVAADCDCQSSCEDTVDHRDDSFIQKEDADINITDESVEENIEDFSTLINEKMSLIFKQEELINIGNLLQTRIESERSRIRQLQGQLANIYKTPVGDLDTSAIEQSDEYDYSILSGVELEDMVSQWLNKNTSLENNNDVLCRQIEEKRNELLNVTVKLRMYETQAAASDVVEGQRTSFSPVQSVSVDPSNSPGLNIENADTAL